jgi:hypothetical protein
VLENQLLLIVRFEYHGVLIEALDPAGKLNPAHQINRQKRLVFPGVIEKSLLDILRKLVHCFIPYLFFRCAIRAGHSIEKSPELHIYGYLFGIVVFQYWLPQLASVPL